MLPKLLKESERVKACLEHSVSIHACMHPVHFAHTPSSNLEVGYSSVSLPSTQSTPISPAAGWDCSAFAQCLVDLLLCCLVDVRTTVASSEDFSQ